MSIRIARKGLEYMIRERVNIFYYKNFVKSMEEIQSPTEATYERNVCCWKCMVFMLLRLASKVAMVSEINTFESRIEYVHTPYHTLSPPSPQWVYANHAITPTLPPTPDEELRARSPCDS